MQIIDNLQGLVKAYGFLSDRIEDEQAAANLHILNYGLMRQTNDLCRINGLETIFGGMDVPY